MQQQVEKDNDEKNNENSTVTIINTDTGFMFHFRKLQKYPKIKFLTLLPSKCLPIMYIRLSYETASKKIQFKLFLSMLKIAQKPLNSLTMQVWFLFDGNNVSNRHVFSSCVYSRVFSRTFFSMLHVYNTYRFFISIKYLISGQVCAG